VHVRAPGRVNLIGGHVDFHDGPVVTAAIDRTVDVDVDVGVDPAGSPHRVRVTSDRFEGEVSLPADGGPDPVAVAPAWGRLVAAVLAELDRLGRPPAGFEAHVASKVPIGGGLSSSAAFEVAIGLAAAAVAGWEIEPVELARAAQRAELAATGVPCGIQDQMSSVVGGVVLLDCRDLSVRTVPIPACARLLVVDSAVPRTLAGSPWTARRAASFDAAAALGVEWLRDAGPLDATADPLARHVVEEIERVWRFAEALEAVDVELAGRLMVESHASSRDLWRSSIPELDSLVDTLVAAGSYGARLTGGGFGGCVVALVPAGEVERIAATASAEHRGRFGLGAVVHHVEVAAGASVEP
jgi:galactokinase